jgi:NAD(P)H dehydrogenase (quinone)
MIAVLGGTGRVGRHVVAGLAAAGVDAVALVREPDRGDLPLPTRRADLRQPETLPAALAGAERLLLLTPHLSDQDLLEAAAIEAAVAAGVTRIVKISGGAATLGPNGTTATATAHWRGEQRIEASGLEFSFLRPSFYMQNLLETAGPTVTKAGLLISPFGSAPIAMVDARDVAACALAELSAGPPVQRAWQLTGPRAIALGVVAERLGVRCVGVPPRLAGQALARRGHSAGEVDHALRMAAYFASGADGAVTDHVTRLTGNPPRSVEDFIDEHRAAFAATTGLARILTRPSNTKAA